MRKYYLTCNELEPELECAHRVEADSPEEAAEAFWNHGKKAHAAWFDQATALQKSRLERSLREFVTAQERGTGASGSAASSRTPGR